MAGRNVLILSHAGTAPREFTLPPPARHRAWRLFLDTHAASPKDIYPNCDGPPPPRGKLTIPERTLLCYVSKD
jgi:glycogen operon protein